MADRRTITISLTASQFAALASAVDFRLSYLEDERVDEDIPTKAEGVLNRAWARVRDQYYAAVPTPKGRKPHG